MIMKSSTRTIEKQFRPSFGIRHFGISWCSFVVLKIS